MFPKACGSDDQSRTDWQVSSFQCFCHPGVTGPENAELALREIKPRVRREARQGFAWRIGALAEKGPRHESNQPPKGPSGQANPDNLSVRIRHCRIASHADDMENASTGPKSSLQRQP